MSALVHPSQAISELTKDYILQRTSGHIQNLPPENQLAKEEKSIKKQFKLTQQWSRHSKIRIRHILAKEPFRRKSSKCSVWNSLHGPMLPKLHARQIMWARTVTLKSLISQIKSVDCFSKHHCIPRLFISETSFLLLFLTERWGMGEGIIHSCLSWNLLKIHHWIIFCICSFWNSFWNVRVSVVVDLVRL